MVFFFSSKEGVWSNQGCVRSEGNMTYSVCLCNHLTNFAILMQVVPLKVWLWVWTFGDDVWMGDYQGYNSFAFFIILSCYLALALFKFS